MIADMRAGRAVTAFVDHVVSPIFVDDVAMVTWQIVERELPPGLYQCVNDHRGLPCGFDTEYFRRVCRSGRRVELSPGITVLKLHAAKFGIYSTLSDSNARTS